MNDFSLQIQGYIKKLSIDHLILFCNLNCEKMLPGYRLFSEIEDWGDFSFFKNLTESVFIYLTIHNDAGFYEKLDEELMENFPELDNFDGIIASYAFDTACAFGELIQYIKTKEINHVIENSQSCINTVDMFVQHKENIRYINDISALEMLISKDEYMQKETSRQLTLLKELETMTLIDGKAIATMKNLNDSFGELVDYKILS
jgi:uncharacterized protein YjaG (DUF416 family)